MIKNYFSGMEETVGRFLSFFATLVFFSIYILSKEGNIIPNLDWSKLMIHLAIFWFVYELLGYILFMVLLQFSKNKKAITGEMPDIPNTTTLEEELKKETQN
jgi:hypothetical protein